MKAYLTREESKELLDLGISPNNTSLVSWKSTRNWDNSPVLDKEHIVLKPFRPAVMGFESFDCQDIFSFTDLLNLIPRQDWTQTPIMYGRPFNLVLGGGYIDCGYETDDGHLTVERPSDYEPINAMFDMIKYFLQYKKLEIYEDDKGLSALKWVENL